MIKEIVVFANSVKHGNSCVAGKCTSTGEWIRPVSNNEGAEISVAQTKKINRRDNDSEWGLKVLNKIKVDLSHHAPLNHQTENYVINQTRWTDEFFIKKHQVEDYLDTPENLWGEGNRVSHHEILNNQEIRNSLYLVKVDELELFKDQYDKRRARFSYGGIDYNLAVTGREFDDNFERNSTFLSNVIICVSLGEDYEGYCYKLVASIIR